MKVVKDLFYTEDHEWVKVEGDEAYVGLSDYAQDSLGDIVYVDLPEVDDEFDKEDGFAAVESVKAAADIYMPVGGTVTAINEDLFDTPELLNQDPYDSWVVKVKLADKAELDELMSSDEYEKFLDEEV